MTTAEQPLSNTTMEQTMTREFMTSTTASSTTISFDSPSTAVTNYYNTEGSDSTESYSGSYSESDYETSNDYGDKDVMVTTTSTTTTSLTSTTLISSLSTKIKPSISIRTNQEFSTSLPASWATTPTGDSSTSESEIERVTTIFSDSPSTPVVFDANMNIK